MSDKITVIQELKQLVVDFVEARDWSQFHTPKNLSMSIAIEAAELMELFQWSDGLSSEKEHLDRVREELADVVIYCLSMANATGIDLSDAVRNKVTDNENKYPVKLFKGRYE